MRLTNDCLDRATVEVQLPNRMTRARYYPWDWQPWVPKPNVDNALAPIVDMTNMPVIIVQCRSLHLEGQPCPISKNDLYIRAPRSVDGVPLGFRIPHVAPRPRPKREAMLRFNMPHRLWGMAFWRSHPRRVREVCPPDATFAMPNYERDLASSGAAFTPVAEQADEATVAAQVALRAPSGDRCVFDKHLSTVDDVPAHH